MKKYSISLLTLAAALTLSGPASAQDNTKLANAEVPSVAEVASPETIDAVGVSPIDYSTYNTFMTKFAAPQQGRPKIAYKLIRENGLEDLQTYLDFLAAQDVSGLPKVDQMAYWLNVQNALVVSAVSQGAKKKKNLKRSRGTGDAPGKLWTTPRMTIAGQNMSIADVENHIVSNFDNPNVLYGIYQGVRGGPCISDEAYTGATVEAELEKNAKRYINSRGIVHVNNDVVELTPIFLWHKDKAFGADDKTLVAHLQNYAEPNLKSALYRAARFEPVELNYGIDFYDLDKVLKDRSQALQPAARRSRAPAPSRPQQQRSRGGGGYGS